MLLPLKVIGITWPITPACGIVITSSVVAPDVRRKVPVQSTEAGSVAGQPLPLMTAPPQLPNSGSFGAWLITTFWPATVKVPTRVSPGFSDTLKVTVPDPLWLLAVLTLTNELLLLTTDHAQPLVVFTANEALPPLPAMLKVVVETE